MEVTEMELTVKTLFQFILLANEDIRKKFLVVCRGALEAAVKRKQISPAIFKEYLSLMREQIFDNTEKKMMSEKKEVLTKEEAKKFIEGNDFIGRSKWSFWIPIIFLLVPEDKFIARKFIDEIIGEWGYGRNRKASEAGKFVHDHSVMTNLNGLLKKGLLERRQLNERGGFSGEDAAKQRKLWCKENVYGPVNPIFGPRTQSVFILTEKGRERALDILEEFALPENDSSKNILDFLDSENAEYFESKRDRLGLKEKEFLNIIFKVARTNDP